MRFRASLLLAALATHFDVMGTFVSATLVSRSAYHPSKARFHAC